MFNSCLKSFLIHVLLAAVLTWWASQNSFLVQGQAGLSGKSGGMNEASLLVYTDPVETKPLPALPAAKLPDDLKFPNPVEMDRTPEPETEAKTKTPQPVDPGSGGQSGSGDQRADQIGNSDRTNLLGLHLAQIQKKVQANLKTPGFLVYSLTAQLRVLVLKSGVASDIQLTRSTGNPQLDLIAIEAVKKSSPFEPFERELTIVIPVIFRSR